MTLSTIKALVAVSSADLLAEATSVLAQGGIEHIRTARTMYDAVDLMHACVFSLFVIDGQLLVSTNPNKVRLAGVDFVRFIRMCEGSVSEAVVVFLRSSGRVQNLFEARVEITEARDAGASCIIAQPFVAENFHNFVRPAIDSPAPFIRTSAYTGPCRRVADIPVLHDRRKGKS